MQYFQHIPNTGVGGILKFTYWNISAAVYCDCFVCSSRTEMLSCVLHECAACGKPAIATRCGGPQDILTEHSGVLVPVDDPVAMAEAMLEMLDKAAGYDRTRIREDIVARFGRDEVCRLLSEACADAAG